MQVFARVSELGSFTKAAEDLLIPKARVSELVKELEDSLGVQLLYRTTRRVSLSKDGEVFYPRCKKLLDELTDIEDSFKSENSASGVLRINMSVGLAKNIIIPALPDFFEKYPDIHIELGCDDRKVDLIKEGLDCVIRSAKLNDSSFVARLLGHSYVGNFVSPEYIKKYGEPKKIKDLTQHFLINNSLDESGKSPEFEYSEKGKYHTLIMPSKITVNNVAAYEQACLSGLGIAQIPIIGARKSLEKGLLIEVLKKYAAEPMPMYLVYPRRENINRRVRIFSEWVQALLSDKLEK